MGSQLVALAIGVVGTPLVDQRKYKVGNLLKKMRIDGRIKVDPSDKKRRWILA